MAEGVVSVCWKDHTSELATVYKSLLENNFLVDCTLSAEGQTLKAHKLVLSACSPYFHKLFREEAGERPIIVLLNASFETLKAVIEFVYQGETHISEGNLNAFLALARSLQIKGLNAFSKNYNNKNLSCDSAKDLQGPSEQKQNTCEVQSISAIRKDSSEKYAQHHPHNSKGYPDAVRTTSSVVTEQGSEEERSTSVMTPIELQKPSESEEVTMDSEITVKSEPLFPAISLEQRIEELDPLKCTEPMSGASEMLGKIDSIYNDQDVNQFSSCSESPHGNTVSSVLPPSQQQLMRLSDEGSSAQGVAERDGPSLPPMLVPKREISDDEEEWGEPMDDFGMAGNDPNESDERTELTNPDMSSIATRMSGSLDIEMDLEMEGHLGTPPDILEEAREPIFDMLPARSKERYMKEYKEFCKWRDARGVSNITETVLLAFFSDMSEKYKPSSLWSKYSMLKATFSIYDNFDTSKCFKLIAFLKRKSIGFQAKKSRSFTREEVLQFLISADDDMYLMMKVAVIMGVYGACRCDELVKMTVKNVEDKDSVLIVNIPDTKTNKPRTFIITGRGNELNPVQVFRKYLALRPDHVNHDRLFLSYRHGKCNIQPVGIHSFCKIPQKVAEFLRLPCPESYTGHCFRKTSASLLAGSGTDVLNLRGDGSFM